MRLRDASGALTTRVVPVRAGRNPSRLAALQWARLTLASLEGEARTNKVRIREIGKRFGLATRETSLIVLELVDDYVRHEIEPPAELRAAYDRAAASIGKRRVESDAARLAQVVRRFEARVAWWNRDFPKGDLPARDRAWTSCPNIGRRGRISRRARSRCRPVEVAACGPSK